VRNGAPKIKIPILVAENATRMGHPLVLLG
jgi:hypothetical protein